MAIITIPKILADRLTDEGARALTDMFKEVEASARDNALNTAEERFERRLAEEVGKLRVEMHALRADIIRWMFIFWAGQIGILFAFFKH